MPVSYPVRLACDRVAATSNAIDAIYHGLNVFHNSTGKLRCFGWTSTVLPDEKSHPHLDSVAGTSALACKSNSSTCRSEFWLEKHSRSVGSPVKEIVPWMYQCCTQFIHPIAGTGMFALPADFWDEQGYMRACQSLYPGSVWNPIPTPLYFNNTFPAKPYSRVLYYVGMFDPVRSYEPSRDVTDTVKVLTVPQGAHCYDIMMQHPNDPQWAVDARQSEIAVLRSWLTAESGK